MGIFGGSAQQPYIPPMPQAPAPAPTMVDSAVVDAANRKKSELAAAGGFGGTVATGGQGLTDPAKVAGKTLLGA